MMNDENEKTGEMLLADKYPDAKIPQVVRGFKIQSIRWYKIKNLNGPRPTLYPFDGNYTEVVFETEVSPLNQGELKREVSLILEQITGFEMSCTQDLSMSGAKKLIFRESVETQDSHL